LPRVSSNTSGLRFCGSRLEPVENPSGAVNQPSAPQHEVLGEPRQVDAEHGGGVQVFEREVAIADDVDAVLGEAREAEPRGEREPVVLERRARHGPGAERHAVGRLARGLEARLVALERVRVREPELREQHGLRGLKVRVRRGRERAGLARLEHERALERAQPLDRLVAEPQDAQARERADLIVATAAGVDAARRIAGALRQLGLDRGVHVLARERDAPGLEIAPERFRR